MVAAYFMSEVEIVGLWWLKEIYVKKVGAMAMMVIYKDL